MGVPGNFQRKLLATVCCVALGGGFSAPAFASEADLIKRIDALQKELESLRSQVKATEQKATKVEQAQAAEKAAAAPMTAQEVATWRKYLAAVPTGEAPATSAKTGITIYGRADLGYESNKDGKVARTVLNSYSSRIGFKGTRVITDDLTGILQIEQKIAPDEDTNSGAWASRESYAGLYSKRFGTIKAGRHDSPFKDLEGVGAPMWGSGDAMEVIIHGKATARSAGSTWSNFHTRFPNVVQYEAPKFANIEAKLAYSTDEVNGASGTVKKPGMAGSVEWDNKTFNAGLAYQKLRSFNGTDKDMTGIKASAGMALGDFTLGALYSKIDNDLGKKTKNWSLAGTYRIGAIVLKASYAKAGETASGAADGTKMLGFEADYNLDKNTALYAYWAKLDNDRNARGRFEQGENTYTPAAGDDPTLFAIAIRYNF